MKIFLASPKPPPGDSPTQTFKNPFYDSKKATITFVQQNHSYSTIPHT